MPGADSETFLKRNERRMLRYEYNKPLIKLCVGAFFVFSLAVFGTFAAGYAYAGYVRPVRDYDVDAYGKAKALSTRITKAAAVQKEARPEDINVCLALQQFLALPDGVAIESFSLGTKSFVVKGIAKDIKACDDYLSMLDFGADYEVHLSDIKTEKEGTGFTLSVTRKVKDNKMQSGKKGGAKK